MILQAQFWAEDGRNWYADAYNSGLLYSLFLPEAGYFQTFSRLIANLSLIVPFEFAPMFFAVSAMIVQIAVAVFIVSHRSEVLARSRFVRICLAFAYLAIPHSWETYANVTNSQWHIALLSFLIIIAVRSETKLGKAFDYSVVALSSISGPFAIFLAPIAVYQWFRHRGSSRAILTTILSIGAAVQVYALATTVRPIQAELGANLMTLIEIISRHVLLSPFIGSKGFRLIENAGLWSPAFAVSVTVAGLVLIAVFARRAGHELKIFGILSLAMVSAALISPAVTAEPGQWQNLATFDTGYRYWLFPSLFLYFLVITVFAEAQQAFMKYSGAFVIGVLTFGIVADWRHPKFPDLNFSKHAERLAAAEKGEEVTVPINPGWEMKLIKK